MDKPYTFHADPGHGWLAVPFAELRELGIAKKITSYSYRSRDWTIAYLEEDCDLSEFFHAKGWKDWPHDLIQEINSNFDSLIRNLPAY